MAYGYGMVTGIPGTCFVIDGPGVTNMTTGIADANTASLPMVVIVGTSSNTNCTVPKTSH